MDSGDDARIPDAVQRFGFAEEGHVELPFVVGVGVPHVCRAVEIGDHVYDTFYIGEYHRIVQFTVVLQCCGQRLRSGHAVASLAVFLPHFGGGVALRVGDRGVPAAERFLVARVGGHFVHENGVFCERRAAGVSFDGRFGLRGEVALGYFGDRAMADRSPCRAVGVQAEGQQEREKQKGLFHRL